MSISKIKFSKFFIYLLIPLALIMFTGMFFNLKLVASSYFFALIIAIVFLILNKRYGKFVSNYKLAYFLFEMINLIAVIAIIYYEFSKHTFVLNLFLILLIVIEIVLIIVDIFYIKNENVNSKENVFVSFAKLCSIICILTYFYHVSSLYFAIDAFVFEIANLIIKIVCNKIVIKENNMMDDEKEESNIEKIINSAAHNDGEIE